MKSLATTAFTLLILMPLTASAEGDLCRSYITKFPALNATFSINEEMKLKNTASYNYQKNGSVEIFTLRKDATRDRTKNQMYPWPMRTTSVPSIKNLEVRRSPSGQIEEINDGRTHLTFQHDNNGRCVPNAIFESPTGKREQASLMASTQVCGTLSNYLKTNPQHKPCVQGAPSVIDATLARHEGDLKSFLNTNPQLNACLGGGPASGKPLQRLLEQGATPFTNVDGVSGGPKDTTLTQSLEGAHVLWKSCQRYALVDYIGEIKPSSQAPAGSSKSNNGSDAGKH